MSYYSQQQHRRYRRRMAALQNKPRAIARAHSQQHKVAAQRLRVATFVAAMATLWIMELILRASV